MVNFHLSRALDKEILFVFYIGFHGLLTYTVFLGVSGFELTLEMIVNLFCIKIHRD